MQEYFSKLNSELDTRLALASSVEWSKIILNWAGGNPRYKEIYVALTPQNKKPFYKLVKWLRNEFPGEGIFGKQVLLYRVKNTDILEILNDPDKYAAAHLCRDWDGCNEGNGCIVIRGDLKVTDEILKYFDANYTDGYSCFTDGDISMYEDGP